MAREGFFDCLEGFKVEEVLEHSQEKIVTKFKNSKDETAVVTQTADCISIKF